MEKPSWKWAEELLFEKLKKLREEKNVGEATLEYKAVLEEYKDFIDRVILQKGHEYDKKATERAVGLERNLSRSISFNLYPR